MRVQQAKQKRKDHQSMTVPAPIGEFLSLLRSEIELAHEIDRPPTPDGEWWIDLTVGGMSSTVLWRERLGFGLFSRDEGGFGDRPDELYRDPMGAVKRLLQMAAHWKRTEAPPMLGLRDVRHLAGETQSNVAQSLGMDQAGVSRLEMRADWKLSTLRDYVEAMGGVLELRVKFPSFEAPIAPQRPSRLGSSRHAHAA